MNPILEVRNVSKSFALPGRRLSRSQHKELWAVKDVSFSVPTGHVVGIVGRSGAGKSTLMRLILRLMKPDRGGVFFEGKDISALRGPDLKHFHASVGAIFQEPRSSFDPRMTIAEALSQPLRVHEAEMSADQRLMRSRELLSRVGLSDEHLNRFPYELSGGQLQRAAIARSLASSPRLLVCDEPTSALDVSIRGQVVNLLLELQAEMGMSYVFVSHDIDVVRAIAQSIVVIANGEIVETEVRDNPVVAGASSAAT